MSLTVAGFSLCGAFVGALAGFIGAYPDGSLTKYAAVGALIGAVVVGGGVAFSRSEDALSTVKGIFIEAGQPSPLSTDDCQANKPAGGAVVAAVMQPDRTLLCSYRPQ